jgi:flagellar motility protein MotE (MotC chaperone)
MRYFRLLPAVILVTVALLGLKGEGLLRSAWAEEQKSSTTNDLLAKDTAPLAADPAANGPSNESPSEVDVMSSLARRRAALDTREGDIAMRAQVLQAAEARVDAKIATLKKLQEQIDVLVTQRDADQQKQVASLVKTYSAMKSKDAARIFNTLPDEVLVPVAQQMKSDVLAPVLAAMTADNAQRLTQKLANRLKMPETPTATAPVPVVPGTAPQTGAPATSPAPKASK